MRCQERLEVRISDAAPGLAAQSPCSDRSISDPSTTVVHTSANFGPQSPNVVTPFKAQVATIYEHRDPLSQVRSRIAREPLEVEMIWLQEDPGTEGPAVCRMQISAHEGEEEACICTICICVDTYSSRT